MRNCLHTHSIRSKKSRQRHQKDKEMPVCLTPANGQKPIKERCQALKCSARQRNIHSRRAAYIYRACTVSTSCAQGINFVRPPHIYGARTICISCSLRTHILRLSRVSGTATAFFSCFSVVRIFISPYPSAGYGFSVAYFTTHRLPRANGAFSPHQKYKVSI